MKKCIIFHTNCGKSRKLLALSILLFLSGIRFVFARESCIEPIIEDIIPELKEFIQNDELGPSLPKIPKPKIIIDLTGKTH
jgi:hypothetical protein